MTTLLSMVGLAVCVAGVAIGAGLLLHRIASWYLDGAISGIGCALMAGAYIGLVISVITLPTLTGKMISLLLIAALFLLLPALSAKLERSSERSFRNERVSQFRAAIESDPRNLAARTRLADELYRLGNLDGAIDELAQLVQIAPHSREEAHRLNQMILEREERQMPPVTCPSCGHKNASRSTHCVSCEADLRLSSEFKRWLAGGGLRQFAVSWAIGMAVVTVILFAFSALSVAGKIVLAALVLLVVMLAQFLHAYRNF